MVDNLADIFSGDKITRAMNMAVAAADPKIRAKVIQNTQVPLREGIMNDYGHLLEISPAAHMIPIVPQAGKETETLEQLTESAKWAQSQEGVRTAVVYKLVTGDERAKAPAYIMAIISNDKGIMQRLKNHPEGAQFQKTLMNASGGKSATDTGIKKISSIFIGV